MIQRSDRGFALLTVLWVLTALTALASVGVAAAHVGSLTTHNRIALSRAAWAREACTEIVLSRFAQDSTIRRLDTIDLGRGTWCAATIDDPSAKLDTIKAPVMFVNSGDDFINPPEQGIAESEIKKVKNGKFVLLPASEQTHGHGTHTYAAVWQQYLKELLDESQH